MTRGARACRRGQETVADLGICQPVPEGQDTRGHPYARAPLPGELPRARVAQWQEAPPRGGGTYGGGQVTAAAVTANTTEQARASRLTGAGPLLFCQQLIATGQKSGISEDPATQR